MNGGKKWTKEDNDNAREKMRITRQILDNTPENEGVILCFFTGERLSEEECQSQVKAA